MKRWVSRGIRIAMIGIAAVLIFGFLVMSLWNWIGPEVFGARTISFWQALGILVLSRLLFGGFGRAGRGGHWRSRMRARWEQMTPEERERMRQGMASRCHREPAAEQPGGTV
jgi:hypothetical protein